MLDTGHTSKHKLLLTVNTHCRVSFVSFSVLDPPSQPSNSTSELQFGVLLFAILYL
jgi:hypothetical protein